MITKSDKYWDASDVANLYTKFVNDTNFWTKYLSWNKWTPISIGKFYKANPAEFDFKKVSKKNGILDIDKLSKWSIALSKKYFKFVKSVYPKKYTLEEEQKIEFWFQGAVGEYFFIEIMPKNNILLEKGVGNPSKLVTLTNVTPYDRTGKNDYGIDFIAVNQDNIPVTGQIKFWSSHSDKMIGWENVFGKLVAESQGGKERITDPDENNNLFVMWLGDELNNVSISLQKQENYSQLSVIGRHTITKSVGNNKSFVNIWNQKWANLK